MILVALYFRHLTVGDSREQTATNSTVRAIGFYPALNLVLSRFGFGSFHEYNQVRRWQLSQRLGLHARRVDVAIRRPLRFAISAAKPVKTGVFLYDKNFLGS